MRAAFDLGTFTRAPRRSLHDGIDPATLGSIADDELRLVRLLTDVESGAVEYLRRAASTGSDARVTAFFEVWAHEKHRICDAFGIVASAAPAPAITHPISDEWEQIAASAREQLARRARRDERARFDLRLRYHLRAGRDVRAAPSVRADRAGAPGEDCAGREARMSRRSLPRAVSALVPGSTLAAHLAANVASDAMVRAALVYLELRTRSRATRDLYRRIRETDTRLGAFFVDECAPRLAESATARVLSRQILAAQTFPLGFAELEAAERAWFASQVFPHRTAFDRAIAPVATLPGIDARTIDAMWSRLHEGTTGPVSQGARRLFR